MVHEAQETQEVRHQSFEGMVLHMARETHEVHGGEQRALKAQEAQRKSDVKSVVLDHKSAGCKRMVGLECS